MVRLSRSLAVVALTTVLSWTAVGAQSTPHFDPASSAAWRAKGLQLGYNLDRAEAIAAFHRAAEADPDSPAAHRLVAASAWTALLFDQGAVTVDDYLGTTRDVERPPPDPEWSMVFRTSIDRALTLAEAGVRAHPDDVDAQYQLGATNGLLAAYTATVEGRVAGSLRFVRRAYRTHERLLAVAPQRKDAGLIVGVYRYTVSTLSIPKRLAAYLAGLGGGRDQGLRLVESAAAYHSDTQAQAQFSLILLYNREKRYDDALRVIRQLKEQFPRNRLLWLEEGNTWLRAERPEKALRALETGLAHFLDDARPRARGEESRWRYAYGAALASMSERAAAERELSHALSLAERDWVRGRIHVELGKLSDRVGDRTTALSAYREAERRCRLDRDESCLDDVRTQIKKGRQP
jgi:tetratricopeptide (TPR) repeat protein